jgi:hypothetical protein
MDERLKKDMSRFAKLNYDDFKRLAADESLSPYQRIGFPDSYREGFEPAIVQDIIAKMPPLQEQAGVVVDIGCGCTDMPRLLAEHAARHQHELVFVDSEEMLNRVPSGPNIKRVAGKFPAMPALVDEYRGRATAVIAYSVLHYVFEGEDLFGFLDAACGLLAPGGHLLIGDIPNASKRRRFFASETGVAFHKAFMKADAPPVVEPFALEPARIDDGVVFGIVMRYRSAGFDAYVLPQSRALPLQNRREDLLIVRP